MMTCSPLSRVARRAPPEAPDPRRLQGCAAEEQGQGRDQEDGGAQGTARFQTDEHMCGHERKIPSFAPVDNTRPARTECGMDKRELRAVMTALIKGVEPDDLRQRSQRIASRLAETEAWKGADTVLAFLSMPHELETAGLIAAARAEGKRVAVPLIEGEEIRFLRGGERPRRSAPRPLGHPGARPRVAGAGSCARGPHSGGRPWSRLRQAGQPVGQGQGLLRPLSRPCPPRRRGDIAVIGICLSEQVVDAVPHDAHDQSLDGIVTERETVLIASLP